MKQDRAKSGKVNSEKRGGTATSSEGSHASSPFAPHLSLVLFCVIAWLWAAWWMGDIFRVAYEQSSCAADATLMLTVIMINS